MTGQNFVDSITVMVYKLMIQDSNFRQSEKIKRPELKKKKRNWTVYEDTTFR